MKGFKVDASGNWIEVSPGATLDYAEEWADWLGTDTLATVVWTVPTGITISAQSNTPTLAKAWLAGFTLNLTYEVSCKVTTAAGRIDARVFRLICKKR